MLTDIQEVGTLPPGQRQKGWRAQKGPQAGNTSGLRATGHRVLLETEAVEEKSAGGIIFVPKTVDKEKSSAVKCRVVEIAVDCWADKSTDYCDVGDWVLVGQYTGKFQTSHKDGKEYRIVSDLDIITVYEV
jgi:co-chaperonin GroES (HSP10)